MVFMPVWWNVLECVIAVTSFVIFSLLITSLAGTKSLFMMFMLK